MSASPWYLSKTDQVPDLHARQGRHLFGCRCVMSAQIHHTSAEGGEEHWIYYNTTKFSGKRLVVKPGASFRSVERGVYSVLVWSGRGTFGGLPVEGGDPDRDELLVTHDRATGGVEVRNSGGEDLLVITFFGPDLNPDVPMLPSWGGAGA